MSDAAIRRCVSAAWVAVALLAAAMAAGRFWYFAAYPRIQELGEGALSSAQWLAVDWLFVVWFNHSYLFTAAFAAAAWTTWKFARSEAPTSWSARCAAIALSVAAGAGSLYFALPLAPGLILSTFMSGTCETTIYAEAPSPDRRYNASVLAIDCGAMSSVNRQIVLTRKPFPWMGTSILYFNGHPALGLEWKGRTLTITGDKPVNAMDHPPPERMVWGGVVARYAAAGEKK